ncbi:hypothetical protein VTN00DRAFT_2443 [Thermoascus crustaceus]|uniref:uncharacterized protein n=1 Tax=Thermoascus crustaceus TaxID=5088 RepID=UPI003743BFF7
MSPRIVLILGRIPRIGWAVAQKFREEGYCVAIGGNDTDIERAEKEGLLPLAVDVGQINSVEDAFEEVKRQLGIPNVVVYHAEGLAFPQDPADPFSIAPAALLEDMATIAVGGYTSLREAVSGFKALDRTGGRSLPKAFIATGSVMSCDPEDLRSTWGASKAALLNALEASAYRYGKDGYRFYLASQIEVEGDPHLCPVINGDAHAMAYWKLTEQSTPKDDDERSDWPLDDDWNVWFVSDGTLIPAHPLER